MKRVIVSFVVLIFGCSLDNNSKMQKQSSRLIGENRSVRLGQEKKVLGAVNFSRFSDDSGLVPDFQNYKTLKAIEKKIRFTNYDKIEFLEGTKSISVAVVWSMSVKWIKIKARDLFDEQGDSINELKGIKYSYLVSPVSGAHISYAMPLIIFETTSEADPLYSVSGFKLITKGSDINFNASRGGLLGGIPMSEKSVEKGLVTAYPFGSSDAKKIVDAFTALNNNGSWNDMIAEITVKSKQKPRNEKVYKISLDSKLFNVAMTKIIEKYPEIKTKSSAFKSFN
ncbi:S2/P23 family protein [Borreliella lusitaniae]|uniref:S2/P23 family protein n=1 Tax=Borreliella lusitaniae TaxID=100177 RepID=UPI002930068C|nr:S2/P23 family protein [Borreliella lusitaniae]WNY67277.1 S2/P23 family protein [Borreliella lusitaniae]